MLADFLAFLPEQEVLVSSNWYGYTVHWEIQKEQLYLRKVEMERRQPGPVSELQLVAIDGVEEHFAAYKTPNAFKEVFRQLSPWKLHCLDGEYWAERSLFALPLKWGEISPKVDRRKSFSISTGSYF